MLEYLFRNKNVEKILVYLLLHEKAHGTELSRAFDSSLDPIQKSLKKLEEGGLLVSFQEGKTRVFTWNPRYPFLEEIQNLAKSISKHIPEKILVKTYNTKSRKRPRKTGKPLD